MPEPMTQNAYLVLVVVFAPFIIGALVNLAFLFFSKNNRSR